jgi:regulator of extracellular matrix RemA (YlzA/DUF370 family)
MATELVHIGFGSVIAINRTAILFDTGHMMLAAVTAETIAHRLSSTSLLSEEKVEL